MSSPKLLFEVRLPVRRPEIRADDAVAVEGEEIPCLAIVPAHHSVGPGGFHNRSSCRPVTKLLGFSQVLLHRDRAELTAVLLVVIDKLLPAGKTDVGTLDMRRRPRSPQRRPSPSGPGSEVPAGIRRRRSDTPERRGPRPYRVAQSKRLLPTAEPPSCFFTAKFITDALRRAN